ncbi:MAG TPA: hypothetical protein VJR50_03225 [Mycobacterium sp.]|nr:hypothetical protein [Mycobacterium sp.]
MGDELEWPLRGWDAVEAEVLTVRELRRSYTPTYPGVHSLRGAELSAVQRAKAAWLWSRRQGVIAGLSAAAMLGTKWIEPGLPAELIHTNRRPPPLLIVHTDTVTAAEVQRIDGMATTSPARTAFDLGRRLELVDGVARVDALMNATDVKVGDIESVAAIHPGVRGLKRLRETLDLVDGGAESPWESMTRLLFVQNGFPRPETQIRVFDEYGVLAAVIDFGWRDYLVGVDFEGAHHYADPRVSADVVSVRLRTRPRRAAYDTAHSRQRPLMPSSRGPPAPAATTPTR